MSEQTTDDVMNFNMEDTDAPENKEKVYVLPGFRKLKVESFTYDKEDDGKTPLIVMKCTAQDADGNEATLEEKLYISGKISAKGVMSSVVRLQELYKGLTGEPKITIKPTAYTYTKKEKDGSSQSFTIPNPRELCDFLQAKCAGKTAVFKIGGDVGRDDVVYSKLTYSGFLYYTDKTGALCRYKEERDFTDSEYKYAVQKPKETAAPATSQGIANEASLDML